MVELCIWTGHVDGVWLFGSGGFDGKDIRIEPQASVQVFASYTDSFGLWKLITRVIMVKAYISTFGIYFRNQNPVESVLSSSLQVDLWM